MSGRDTFQMLAFRLTNCRPSSLVGISTEHFKPVQNLT